MRHIDEDTITQAVIARHASAGDARLRELMTSLVQHLHAFAREVRITEAEWRHGLRFLSECGRSSDDGDDDGARRQMVLLSHTLGLSTLVAAMNRRAAAGSTEPALLAPWPTGGVDTDPDTASEPCYVRGQVRGVDGQPIAGAEVSVWQPDANAPQGPVRTDAEGVFGCRCLVAEAYPITHDGPVGRLLAALGRHAWRPAHLHFLISAPGHERLVTPVFRDGARYLDSDAVFGVRRSQIAPWVRHAPGRTPDGQSSALPFFTLDLTFVLKANRGDTP